MNLGDTVQYEGSVMDEQDRQDRKFPSLAVLSLVLWFATFVTVISNTQNYSCQSSSTTAPHAHVRIELHNTDDKPPPAFPNIVWLMSFPNSGTSYTLRIVRQITNQTTATNYGGEHLVNDTSVLVNPNWTQGPFRANVSQALPEYFILTKTHCGSRCVRCAPDGYLETQRTFQRECLTGRRHYNESSNVEGMYSFNMVHKAVHLIRNPLDNIVARFHLSIRHDTDLANNATGFQTWCARLDAQYIPYETHTPWLDERLLELWKDVPCHAEFFKYIQWHNLAQMTATSLGIPMHVLRYEDYNANADANNWQSTVESLLSFLRLPAVAWEDASRFEMRSYHDSHYYTRHQQRKIRALIQEVASVPVWKIVEPYFVTD